MSLDTYANLKTDITNWLARSDLTSYYDDWITLFEAYAARKLKVRPMQKTVTLSPASGLVALPADYLGWISLAWSGSTASELEYMHPSILNAYYPKGSGSTGTPHSWSIEAGNIVVRPVDDTSSLTLLYNAKNTAASSTLNWLFTNHPDAYLFGALAESGGYTDDKDKLAFWKLRRDEVFGEISLQNFREPGTLGMRVLGYTP